MTHEEYMENMFKTIDKIKSYSEDMKKETEDKLKIFMEEYEITLMAKDVQYDMINNVGKYFVIDGIAKLSTYYNYGFDDIEKDYFCIRVEPINEKYSDRWYLYCSRNSFSKFFDDLKENGSIKIIAKCIIPLSIYEEGQGNLAQVQTLKW
jgi:hypothetical protein